MPRQAKLVFKNAEGQMQEAVIALGREVLIGRHPNCTITVSRPSVSRKHARFALENDEFIVEDLQSSNGTYVNNQRINRSAIRAGDQVKCGDFEMAVEIGLSVEPIGPAPASAGPKLVGSLKRRSRSPEMGRPTANVMPPPGGPPPLPDEPLDQRPTAPPMSNNQGEVDALRREVESLRRQAEAGNLMEADARTAREASSRAEAALNDARAQVSNITEERDRAARELADLQSDLDARVRRIEEMESEQIRAAQQLKMATERTVVLERQIDELRDQLSNARREHEALSDAADRAEARARDLERGNELTSQREGDLAEENQQLKRKLSTLNKERDTLAKQIEVTEYDLQTAREENQNLRLALGEDDSRRAGLNRRLEELTQILAEKDGMVEQLQGELKRARLRAKEAEATVRSTSREEEITDLQAAVAEARISRDALIEKVEQYEADRQAMTRRIVDQEAEVQRARAEADQARVEADQAQAAAERARSEAANAASAAPVEAPANTRTLMEQINKLRRDNRELKHQVSELEAAGGGGTDTSALEASLEAAEAGRRAAEATAQAAEAGQRRAEVELKAIQRRLEAGEGGGANLEAFRGEVVKLYEEINDMASGLRMNVSVVHDYMDDLAPLSAAVGRIGQEDDAAWANRMSKAFDESDFKLTLDSAQELMIDARESAERFKKVLRAFRDVLRRHGYE